jgi:hypothetical protein
MLRRCQARISIASRLFFDCRSTLWVALVMWILQWELEFELTTRWSIGELGSFMHNTYMGGSLALVRKIGTALDSILPHSLNWNVSLANCGISRDLAVLSNSLSQCLRERTTSPHSDCPKKKIRAKETTSLRKHFFVVLRSGLFVSPKPTDGNNAPWRLLSNYLVQCFQNYR